MFARARGGALELPVSRPRRERTATSHHEPDSLLSQLNSRGAESARLSQPVVDLMKPAPAPCLVAQ